jgi:hypothetical protein
MCLMATSVLLADCRTGEPDPSSLIGHSKMALAKPSNAFIPASLSAQKIRWQRITRPQNAALLGQISTKSPFLKLATLTRFSPQNPGQVQAKESISHFYLLNT